MFVLYRLYASTPPTAWIVFRNKAAREVRCPLKKNWQQVKHSDAIFAVSTIANDDTVNGGTGWAVQKAIDNTNDVVDIMTRF